PPRGLNVQRDHSTQEVARVDVPEDDGRVRDGRVGAAARVTRWSRIGAGAAGPDAQQPTLVYPGDAASAGTDALDVDRREPREVALVLSAQPGFARPWDAPVPDHADVVARPACVGNHGGL